jgi:hypothetical protein
LKRHRRQRAFPSVFSRLHRGQLFRLASLSIRSVDIHTLPPPGSEIKKQKGRGAPGLFRCTCCCAGHGSKVSEIRKQIAVKRTGPRHSSVRSKVRRATMRGVRSERTFTMTRKSPIVRLAALRQHRLRLRRAYALTLDQRVIPSRVDGEESPADERLRASAGVSSTVLRRFARSGGFQ